MLKKGALSLLSNYGTDSSDDDVPGPRVSTKRPHKDDDEGPCLKRLERLPVPNINLPNEYTAPEHIDDPSLHCGRVRTFLHERGNWATYVYIPFDNHEEVQELISVIKKILPSNIEVNEVEDFHISLTRTVILKHHWINEFVNSIKSHISHCKKFMILFEGLKVYCNEERTRTFLGIQIKTGHDSLIKLVESMDKCLGEFSLPCFYKNPSFHMSIAWCVGDFEEELNLALPHLSHQLQELMDSHSHENWHRRVPPSGRMAHQVSTCRCSKMFEFKLTLTCLRSIFHYTVSPFERFAGEIFRRVRLKLHLNCQGRIPNRSEENAA